MPGSLLIATRNAGKIREFQRLFAELQDLRLLTLDEIGDNAEVVEDGDTFEKNARKKAVEVAQRSGMLVLSDDSGLEVDALGGRPGVYSARYAGAGATDLDNNRKLIAELAEVTPPLRTARYRVVLALADCRRSLATHVHVEHGLCEGTIRLEPSGNNGFGYDPYFEPTGHTRTMAELTSEEKNRISHRAQAANKMCRYLTKYLSGRA